MNTRMRALLGNEQVRAMAARPLPPKLQALVYEGFEAPDGLWGFRAMAPRRGSISVEMLHDATGYECFVNKLHLDDFLGEEDVLAPVHEQLGCGLRLVKELHRRLPREERFLILLGCDETHCTVRFHKVRPGESWLTEELECYLDDAILELSNHDDLSPWPDSEA